MIKWKYDSHKDLVIGNTVFTDLYYTIKALDFGFSLDRSFKSMTNSSFHIFLRSAKKAAEQDLAEMIEYREED